MGKLERYDKDAQRIVDDFGKIVGMALRMSNNTWAAFNASEQRWTMRSFASPQAVLAWYNKEGASL